MNYRFKEVTLNPYSRPGISLHDVKALVIHWVANPNITANGVRIYFENKKKGKSGYGSAHYIIDKKEVLQCIPNKEVAYHCGTSKPINKESTQVYTDLAKNKFGRYCSSNSSPNYVTLGIELCHEDWDGYFHEDTLQNAIELCKKLCLQYNLDPIKDIITHNDVVGWKDCPRYFVDNPIAFNEFKKKVKEKIGEETLNP